MSTISNVKDKLWTLVRDVEHRGYHSSANHEVLFKAAVQVDAGRGILGLKQSEVPSNRDAQFYKNRIVHECSTALSSIGAYQVLECSMSKAMLSFEGAQKLLPDV